MTDAITANWSRSNALRLQVAAEAGTGPVRAFRDPSSRDQAPTGLWSSLGAAPAARRHPGPAALVAAVRQLARWLGAGA